MTEDVGQDSELAETSKKQVLQLLEMLFKSGCKIVYTETTPEPEEWK